MGFPNQPGESARPELGSGPSLRQRSGASPAPSLVSPETPPPIPAVRLGAALLSPESTQLHGWLEQLVQGDFQMRWEISKTLKQHPQGILGPLLALLPQAQDDEELLWFIARLLGEIDHPEALETLAGILCSATTLEMQSVAALALASRGRSALPTLAELLHQPEVRPLVVQVLAQIDAMEVVDLLLGLAQDDDALVRRGVMEALSGFGDPRIAPVLLAALQDLDGEVRRFAVRALGARAAHLPDVALDGAIAPLLHDPNPQVVEQAIVALGRLDTALAHRGLIQVLDGQGWPLMLQLQAARALGWSRSAAAVAGLVTQLKADLGDTNLASSLASSPFVAHLARAREIVVVLGRLRAPQELAPAAQALESLLPVIFAQGDGDLKRSAALALGQLGQGTSFDALWGYLEDPLPGLAFHILAALRRLDPDQGRGRLQALAKRGNLEPALEAGVRVAIAEWPH